MGGKRRKLAGPILVGDGIHYLSQLWKEGGVLP